MTPARESSGGHRPQTRSNPSQARYFCAELIALRGLVTARPGLCLRTGLPQLIRRNNPSVSAPTAQLPSGTSLALLGWTWGSTRDSRTRIREDRSGRDCSAVERPDRAPMCHSRILRFWAGSSGARQDPQDRGMQREPDRLPADQDQRLPTGRRTAERKRVSRRKATSGTGGVNNGMPKVQCQESL